MNSFAKTSAHVVVSTSMILFFSSCVPDGRGNNAHLEVDRPTVPIDDRTQQTNTTAPTVVSFDNPEVEINRVGDDPDAFDHFEVPLNQFSVLARSQEEGRPEIASRLHGCQKMQVATLGNLLRSFGVDLSQNATGLTAGALYNGGGQALGAATFASRTPEGTEVTTAGATKLFDIFVQAAPTIITAMPTLARCRVAGQPTNMFDTAGRCTLDGISCLQGYPATEAHQAICDAAVQRGSTPQIGRTIAVAAILAANHTCE